MITVLNKSASIIDEYLHELRDETLQRDRQRFEHNLEMLGIIAGYELSKQLAYNNHQTKTLLGVANTPLLADKLVLSTMLRAGLPVHHGIHTILPTAEPAFIAAGRNPDTTEGVTINLTYVAGPDITGKVLIITDTMLATGHTFVEAYRALLVNHGHPSKVFVVAVIASQPGIDYVSKHIPNCEVVACALDPELNDDYFIVPGLGDAGDLLYGEKI